MQKMKHFIAGMTLCGMLFVGGATQAANVDYTGLEKIFGEPVTTSATGKPQRISETPVSMDIISSEEIKRSGANDIPQVLKRLAGVDVSRNYRGHADVNVRGFNQPFSNRLLVLINGRQVYLDNYGFTLWHSFPVQMSEIKQIEVVRGPNTSLFGFNAASGVVNIITFNPAHDDVNLAQAGWGSHGHKEMSLVKTFKFSDRFSARLSGGWLNMNGFSRDELRPTISAKDAVKSKSFNLDTLWTISDNSYLRVEGGVNSQESDTTFPYYTALRSDTITRHLSADYTHDSGDNGLWNLRVYRNELDFDTVPQDNRLHVVKLSNLLSLNPEHTVRFGAEYRNNLLKGSSVGNDDGEFSMDIYSGSGMWNWHVNDKVSLTNSVRFDHWKTKRKGTQGYNDSYLGIKLSDYNREDTEFSFNAGVLYKFAPRESFRLSAARGIRVPSLDEMALDYADDPGAEFYGNPLLDIEESTSFEIGYSRDLESRKMTLGGTLFYQRVHNVIAPTVNSLGSLGGKGGAEADFTFENVGDAKAYGIELSVKERLMEDRLRWYANYTYLLSQDDPLNGYEAAMEFEGTQPKHKFNAGVGYSEGQWNFDVDAHYVSSLNYRAVVADFVSSHVKKNVDDYVTLNASVGYKLSDSTYLSLNGYNLVDEHYERPAITPTMGLGPDSRLGSNKMGRSVVMRLQHRF